MAEPSPLRQKTIRNSQFSTLNTTKKAINKTKRGKSMTETMEVNECTLIAVLFVKELTVRLKYFEFILFYFD